MIQSADGRVNRKPSFVGVLLCVAAVDVQPAGSFQVVTKSENVVGRPQLVACKREPKQSTILVMLRFTWQLRGHP